MTPCSVFTRVTERTGSNETASIQLFKTPKNE